MLAQSNLNRFVRRNVLPSMALALAAGTMMGVGLRQSAPAPACPSPVALADGPSVSWAEASVILLAEDGHGSGAILSSDGWILTNYHVVESSVQAAALTGGVATLRAELGKRDGERIRSSGELLTATVFRTDPTHDLALVKVALPEGHAPLPFYSLASDVHTGEEVFAIGSPGAAVPWTIKRGNLAAVTHFPEGDTRHVVGQAMRSAGYETRSLPTERLDSDMLATTAAIAPGDSGGPLLNVRGELIGLNQSMPADEWTRMSYHIALPEVKSFVSALPTTIEAAPFDLWTLGLEGVHTLARGIDADGDGLVDAAAAKSFAQSNDGVTQVGAAIYFDLSGGQDAAVDRPLTPGGLWSFSSSVADFRADLVLVQRGDGLKAVGYGNESGLIVEIRLDRDGDNNTDLVWTRSADGPWSASTPADALPTLDSTRLSDSQTDRLNQLGHGRPARVLAEAME